MLLRMVIAGKIGGQRGHARCPQPDTHRQRRQQEAAGLSDGAAAPAAGVAGPGSAAARGRGSRSEDKQGEAQALLRHLAHVQVTSYYVLGLSNIKILNGYETPHKRCA